MSLNILRFGILCCVLAGFFAINHQTAAADAIAPDIFHAWGESEELNTAPKIAAQEQKKQFRLPPLVYYSSDPEADTVEFEVLFPLFDYRKTAERDRFRLFHLFSIAKEPNTDGARSSALFNLSGVATKPGGWRTWLFPVAWVGVTQNSSHKILFPIYYHLKESSSNLFAIFPLYLNSESKRGTTERKTNGYLFLAWKGQFERKTDSATERGKYFHVFPFLWTKTVLAGDQVAQELNSAFPLYYYKKVDREDKRGTRKSLKWSALYLYWASESDSQQAETQNSSKKQYIPFVFKKEISERSDLDRNSLNAKDELSILSLFKMREKVSRWGGGSDTFKTVNGRVFPLLWWGEDYKNEEKTKHHRVLFPFYWDLFSGGDRVKALVPLGATLTFDNFKAVNLLGPAFTRIDNKEKDYVRYDALFPLLMKKTGSTENATRVVPLFTYIDEQGERRRLSLLGSLFFNEQATTKVKDPLLFNIIGEMAQAWLGAPKKSRTAGELHERIGYLYGQRRRAAFRLRELNPLFWQSFYRAGARDVQQEGCVLLGLYKKTTATEPNNVKTSFLSDIVRWDKGESGKGWNVFPLASKQDRQRYSSYQDKVTDQRELDLLWPLISYNHREERPDLDAEVELINSSLDIPLLVDSSKTEWPLEGEHSQRINLFSNNLIFDRDKDGNSEIMILDPLYGREKTAKGEVEVKSLGGLAYHKERDINGFVSERLLNRAWRHEKNSRSSSWMLGPLAFGERNRLGEKQWGLLGGLLLNYRKDAAHKQLRFLLLPVYQKKLEGPTTLSEQETLAVAQRHLELGLKYLASKNPDRAMLELSLAEPAFGDDPALYERLGDAYAAVQYYPEFYDHVEKIIEDLKKYTSDYPDSIRKRWGLERVRSTFYEEQALAAYQRVIELGGESVLLRRKMIFVQERLLADPQEKKALYKSAMAKYPHDYSLWLDTQKRYGFAEGEIKQIRNEAPASFVFSPSGCYEMIQYLKDEDWRKLDWLHGSLYHNGDEPKYQPLFPKNNDWRSVDYRELCRQEAARLLYADCSMNMARGTIGIAKHSIERLFELNSLPFAKHQVIKPSRIVPWLERIFVGDVVFEKSQLAELPGYLREKCTQHVTSKAALAEWQREIRRLERDLSYVNEWAVYGPVAADQVGVGKEGLQLADCGADRQKWSAWRGQPGEQYVNLMKHFDNAEFAGAFCSVMVTSPEELNANLLLGFDERAKVWLNGELVFGPKRRKIASLDEFKIPVQLNQGENELVIGLENRRLVWGLFARIADDDGQPLKQLQVRMSRTSAGR